MKIKILQIFSTHRAAKEAFRIFTTPLSRGKRSIKEVFQKKDAADFEWHGKHIAGYRINPGGTKKLLLLHGFSSNCNNFERYVEPAVEKGYQVYAFDAPAHGLSGGKRTNVLEYAQFIVDLNNRFGHIDSYIAHSFGGISACLALEQLNHDEHTRLVLIAPATETTTVIKDAFSLLHIKSEKLKKEFEHLIQSISGYPSSWFSIRRAMHHIKASVLWLHDMDDDITPVEDAMQVQQDHHPNIRFIFTHHLGHRKIYRDEEQMANVMNFL